jgi:hypothetical protein
MLDCTYPRLLVHPTTSCFPRHRPQDTHPRSLTQPYQRHQFLLTRPAVQAAPNEARLIAYEGTVGGDARSPRPTAGLQGGLRPCSCSLASDALKEEGFEPGCDLPGAHKVCAPILDMGFA